MSSAKCKKWIYASVSGEQTLFFPFRGEQTQLKWLYPSTPSLVRRGNQAQQQNFRSSSKSPDPSFRDVQPLHSFHSNGTLRWAFVLARSGCVYYSHSFQQWLRGLLRAETTVLPMQAEHPSLFVQWVGEGAAGKDAVSLLRDNGGLGSCLWHNKGTSLLLVLFT